MVAPVVKSEPHLEITVLAQDANSILYDMPYGVLSFGDEDALVHIANPSSILECVFAALDRITTIESPKLSEALSDEKRREMVRALHVKRAITHDLLEFSTALPEEDNLSKIKPDLMEVYRGLDKAEASIFLKK
jgi:GTP1/Obg family GTP-binding protein